MSDGWRADLNWLKSDLVKSESRFASSSSAGRCISTPSLFVNADPLYSTVTKLVQARPTLHEDVDSALVGLTAAQREFATSFADKASVALQEAERAAAQTAEDHERASFLGAEFTRLRRMMVEHTLETEKEGG